MSTPATIIYLCRGVRLNNRYEHTLYFSTRAEQDEYFAKKVVKTLTGYSYARKSWTLKIADTMENARLYSYLFFKNPADNKTYYYFINDVKYIHDAAVELVLELDVMQSYLFDFQMQRCYVEREHSERDDLYSNLVDEGLDVGEYVINSTQSVPLGENLNLMIAATAMLPDAAIGNKTTKIISSKIDGMFGGLGVFSAPMANYDTFKAGIYEIMNNGKIDIIHTMWLYPGELFESENTSEYDEPFFNEVQRSKSVNHTVMKNTTLNGYQPNNKKLLQYPYNFLYVTNNNGAAAIYKYEHFDENYSMTFKVTGNLSPDAVVKLTPMRYKGHTGANVDEGLSLTGFPLCTWDSDTYKLWLAQNQNSQNLNYLTNGIKIVAGIGLTVASKGIGAGVGGGLIASGATGIASQLAQNQDRDVQPTQARGTFHGSHNITNGWLGFTIEKKSITSDYAQIIDDFFTMYGYATRRVKVPNISARPCWNYVKTVGSNVTGDFAVEDINKINSIFDNGVTFWKKTALIGDYSHNNAPV